MADRETSEEKVITAVKEWLPDLVTPGSVIQVTACDPDENDGASFTVTRDTSFVCRRGR